MDYFILFLVGYLLPMIICQGLTCLLFYFDDGQDSWGKKQDFKLTLLFSMIPVFNIVMTMAMPFVFVYAFIANSKFIDNLYHKLIDKNKD